jgi:hypothetical protein
VSGITEKSTHQDRKIGMRIKNLTPMRDDKLACICLKRIPGDIEEGPFFVLKFYFGPVLNVRSELRLNCLQ